MKFISRLREITPSIVDIEECYVIKNKANGCVQQRKQLSKRFMLIELYF